jgi:hypothetical protein
MQEKIFTELFKLNARIGEIEKVLIAQYAKPIVVSDSLLLNLPDHLRRSYICVCQNGGSNAFETSIQTGRTRSIECSHLNQLCRLGYLNKQHKGKAVVFSVKVNPL